MLHTGQLTKDSSGKPVSTSLLTGTKSSALGLLAQLNIGPMPDAWLTAINNTFLVKDTTTLGSRNL